MKRRRWLLFAVPFLTAVIYASCFVVPAGPRSLRAFDPVRTADLELDMWKAYYDERNLRLFTDLVILTHEQNRYPWSKAARASFYLARAASTFAKARGNYERVLPDLEHAYTIARDWTNARFDPAAVAKAELAWWVARRVPGQDSPENVGGLIADLNAQLYDVPRDKVLEASVLRARAGRLRDEGGQNADWAQVAALLRESYQSLHAAVNP
jgi:hypothetical protein